MSPTSATSQAAAVESGRQTSHTCPFCSLLCDDLTVTETSGKLSVAAMQCPKALAGYERVRPAASPMIAGNSVSLEAAVREASRLLRECHLPLFGGLATDVEGMRGLLALAEKTGGIVDHAMSRGIQRNMRILQTRGWILSTLTEARNRADVMVVAGSDVAADHPRLFEKIAAPAETMFLAPGAKRTVIVVGEGLDASVAAAEAAGADLVQLPCPPDRVGEVFSLVRARLKGKPIGSIGIEHVGVEDIDALLARLQAASYGVIAWSAGRLDFPGGDLAIEAITELIKDLNVSGRFGGLAIGGSEGATTANGVCTWQSGYPLRVSYASGAPVYDPYRHDIARCLAEGEGDLLVWTASISPGLVPPDTELPTILIGTPGLPGAETAAVFLPVGTPGIDHPGRMIRVDSVVAQYLRPVLPSGLPAVANIADQIRSAL